MKGAFTNDTTKEEYDAYWARAMSVRMGRRDEVTRLTSILIGFYYRSLNYATTQPGCESHHPGTLEDFWDSKRPYGNKNVPASIAFNLGWDYARAMCHVMHHIPDWVEEEAKILHQMVFEEIKDVSPDDIWRI